MSAFQTPVFTERQLRAIDRIVHSLERVSQRTDPLYARVRKHDRKSYCGPLSVFVPKGVHTNPDAAGKERWFPAWAYSLSQGGVGLVMLNEISVPEMWVGMHLPNNTIRWMYGRIVRRRAVPEEEFFDYGLSFQTRSEPTVEDADSPAVASVVDSVTAPTNVEAQPV